VRELVNQPKLLEFDRLQPRAMSALRQLDQAGVKLSLVTLRAHDQAVHMLKRFGIYHYFASIQGSTDEFAAYDNYAHSKTAMLSKTMSSMALGESESIWMIGDTEADILSAKALGVESIALSCGMRSRAYLQRLEPYIVLDDLEAAAELVLNKLKYAEFSPA
jgi:phosphoglycolate phosphatase-like HAD superfamily hydrolase